MATPGWYPDPSGQPQMFRYWDGASWSEQTTSDPSAPPPGQVPPAPTPPTQAAPGQPGQYGQYGGQSPYQQYGQQPGQYGPGGYAPQNPYGQGHPGAPGGSGGGGTGKRVALVALAVLLIAGLAVGGFFGARALTDDGDDTAGDDTSQTEETQETEATESATEETESASPTEESESASPTESGPTGQECTGGQPEVGGELSGDGSISGGGLQLPPVGGFEGVAAEPAFKMADGVATVGRQIEEGWIALYAVGALPKDNGYTDLAASVDQVITCMTESPDFYRGFSGRNDLNRESIDVDGHTAYSVTTEIRVDDPNVTVEGDVTRVIVVDTGDEEAFGLYISVVPIGDQRLIDQQEKATARLSVP